MNAFKLFELSLKEHIRQSRVPGAPETDYAAMWGSIAPILESLSDNNKLIEDVFLGLAMEYRGRPEPDDGLWFEDFIINEALEDKV